MGAAPSPCPCSRRGSVDQSGRAPVLDVITVARLAKPIEVDEDPIWYQGKRTTLARLAERCPNESARRVWIQFHTRRAAPRDARVSATVFGFLCDRMGLRQRSWKGRTSRGPA